MLGFEALEGTVRPFAVNHPHAMGESREEPEENPTCWGGRRGRDHKGRLNFYIYYAQGLSIPNALNLRLLRGAVAVIGCELSTNWHTHAPTEK